MTLRQNTHAQTDMAVAMTAAQVATIVMLMTVVSSDVLEEGCDMSSKQKVTQLLNCVPVQVTYATLS